MKIELKQWTKLDGQVWYGVVIDGQYQSPCYTTEIEGKEAFDKAVHLKKNVPSSFEVILLSTEL